MQQRERVIQTEKDVEAWVSAQELREEKHTRALELYSLVLVAMGTCNEDCETTIRNAKKSHVTKNEIKVFIEKTNNLVSILFGADKEETRDLLLTLPDLIRNRESKPSVKKAIIFQSTIKELIKDSSQLQTDNINNLVRSLAAGRSYAYLNDSWQLAKQLFESQPELFGVETASI